MKRTLLALALATTSIHAQEVYRPKGWVMYDSQDGKGKWHLGAKDKRQHAAAGLVIGAVTFKFAETLELKNPRLWAFFATLAVGYLKEVYDIRRGSGTGEHCDALWTAAGGYTGATLASWRW